MLHRLSSFLRAGPRGWPSVCPVKCGTDKWWWRRGADPFHLIVRPALAQRWRAAFLPRLPDDAARLAPRIEGKLPEQPSTQSAPSPSLVWRRSSRSRVVVLRSTSKLPARKREAEEQNSRFKI